MTLDRIFAGWRNAYVSGVAQVEPVAGECVFCALFAADATDRERLVVHRGETCVVMLNLYPYGSGHLLVMPRRHVAALDELTGAERVEFFGLLVDASQALQKSYSPDGMNVGANLGRAAGAGVPGHLHFHALPRWGGDTNFMTAIGETRVIPEDLATSYDKIRGGVADVSEQQRDALPPDLNLDEYVGVTTFPDPGRRRVVGALWVVCGAVAAVVAAANGTDGVLVNEGLVAFAAGALLVGLYHFAAGARLALRETDALAIAAQEVGFPIGHASAQLGFQGLLSRPTWRILLYSADNPPTKRGMVLIDGRTRAVLGNYVEDNPEDPKIWAGA